jgi:hypothetical protein
VEDTKEVASLYEQVCAAFFWTGRALALAGLGQRTQGGERKSTAKRGTVAAEVQTKMQGHQVTEGDFSLKFLFAPVSESDNKLNGYRDNGTLTHVHHMSDTRGSKERFKFADRSGMRCGVYSL